MLVRFPSGVVTWIGCSPARRAPIVAVEDVAIEVDVGLVGDWHTGGGRGKRHVTLVQAEHLAAVAAILGRPVEPAQLRRNLVVSGINVWALQDRVFRVGEAVLQGTGPCAPCNRMEENLGPGGYLAMRGHGGITARVLVSGRLRIGDPVVYVEGSGDPSLTAP